MRILLTSDLSGMGGGETSLVNMCRALSADHEITVICNVDGKLVKILKDIGIETHIVNYREKSSLLSNIVKIRKIVLERKVEVIHSNDPLTSVIFYFATLGLKRQNYWTCHGQWYNFAGMKRFLIKFSNRHIFCVSSSVEESLKRMGFVRTSVTYLGVPVEDYKSAKSIDLRGQYGIAQDTLLVAAIGRYQRIKGQMKLVKAIAQLSQQGKNIVCMLIGGCVFGNEEENRYLHEIKQFINEHDLDKKIILTGERDDVPQILKSIDAVIIPSDNESFGMIAIESLAAGTPVFSTPNDGVSEILSYNATLLSETNDVEGLAKIIGSFIDNREVLQEARCFAKARCNDFDIHAVAAGYMSIFMQYGG